MQSSNNPKLQAIIARKKAIQKKREEEPEEVTAQQLYEKKLSLDSAKESYEKARDRFLKNNPLPAEFGPIHTKEVIFHSLDKERLEKSGVDISKFQKEKKILCVYISKKV